MYSNNLEKINNQTITAEELVVFSMFIQQLPCFKEANNIIPTLAKYFHLETVRKILIKNKLKELEVILQVINGNRRYTLNNYFVALPKFRERMIQGKAVTHTGHEFAEDFVQLFSEPETAMLVSENFKKGFEKLPKSDRETFAVRWQDFGTDVMLSTLSLTQKSKKLKRERPQLTTTPLEKIDVNITHNEVIIYFFMNMLYRVNYKNNYIDELIALFDLEKVIKALVDTKLRYLSEVLFKIKSPKNRNIFINYFLCTLERRQLFSRGSHLKQDIDTNVQLLFVNEEEKNIRSLEIALQQLAEKNQRSIKKRFKEKAAHIKMLQPLVDKLPLDAAMPQTNLLEDLPQLFRDRPDIEESLLKNLDLISIVKESQTELPSVAKQLMSQEVTLLRQTVIKDESEKSRPLKRQKLKIDEKTLVLSNETVVNEQSEESIWKDLLLDQLDSLEDYVLPTHCDNCCNVFSAESPEKSLSLFGLFANQSKKIDDQANMDLVPDIQFSSS